MPTWPRSCRPATASFARIFRYRRSGQIALRRARASRTAGQGARERRAAEEPDVANTDFALRIGRLHRARTSGRGAMADRDERDARRRATHVLVRRGDAGLDRAAERCTAGSPARPHAAGVETERTRRLGQDRRCMAALVGRPAERPPRCGARRGQLPGCRRAL